MLNLHLCSFGCFLVQCGFLLPLPGPVFKIWLLGTSIYPLINTVKMLVDVNKFRNDHGD